MAGKILCFGKTLPADETLPGSDRHLGDRTLVVDNEFENGDKRVVNSGMVH